MQEYILEPTEREQYNLIPHVGVGEIRLGMTKAEVHQILDEPRRTKKNFASSGTIEFYPDQPYKVSFNSSGICEAIGMPELAQVLLNGEPLLSRNPDELIDYLKHLDPDVFTDDLGIASPRLKIALSVPSSSPNDLEFRTTSITICNDEYFEGMMEADS